MRKLWAPWRVRYIQHLEKKRGCVFCGRIKSKKDSKNFVVKRTRYSVAMLNIYPYSNGHVMVMPKRHVKNFKALSVAEKCDLLDLTELVKDGLMTTFRPHGFNMGINIGRAAGAGIPGHLHIHIVPRWVGDTNFMPVFSNTKVVSESLESAYKKLNKCLTVKQSKRKK